jgi:hypothetical protein
MDAVRRAGVSRLTDLPLLNILLSHAPLERISEPWCVFDLQHGSFPKIITAKPPKILGGTVRQFRAPCGLRTRP